MALGFGLGLALAGSWGTSATARTGTDPSGGESVRGRMVDAEGSPVAGVTVAVAQQGRRVGTVRSGRDGRFEIPVPSAGQYQVSIDPSSIPVGSELRDPDRTTLPNVRVQEGQRKFVAFPLGDPAPAQPERANRVAVAALSGLRLGLIVAIAGAGLTVVYAATGLVNFAHGELLTFGAIVAWYLNSWGVHLVAAAVLAAAAGGLLGATLDVALWRPARRRRVGPGAAMVVSVGLALLLRNVFLLVLEGPARAFRQFSVQVPWRFGGVHVLPRTAVIVAGATVVLAGAALALTRTLAGTAARGVFDDHELAETAGIDVDRTIRVVWSCSGALAALAGVMIGAADRVQWDMGVRFLLVTIAAVIVGGLGSVSGAVAGALFIGIVSEMSALVLPDELKLFVALAAMVLVLLARPRGILGVRNRVA